MTSPDVVDPKVMLEKPLTRKFSAVVVKFRVPEPEFNPIDVPA